MSAISLSASRLRLWPANLAWEMVHGVWMLAVRSAARVAALTHLKVARVVPELRLVDISRGYESP